MSNIHPTTQFKKGHPFYKGAEKGWFKRGHISLKKGTGEKHREKICLFCGKTFCGAKHRKFCCHKCAGLFDGGKDLPINRMYGENNPNWQGGITPLLRKIRKCFKYRQWRSDIFQRDDFTCQNCEIKGGRLEAHQT